MANTTLSGKKTAALAEADPLAAARVAAAMGVEPSVATVLLARYLAEHGKNADLNGLIAPPVLSETQSLPPYASLKGMSDATDAVATAIQTQQKIAVYGDYDADGNTASAIIADTIRDYTGELPLHYIPWRKEGYGLNKPAILKLHDQGAKLLIVVDCGTTSVAEVDYAKSLGMQVVIIDHHRPRPQDPLPDCPLVNPSRLDDGYLHKSVCAAGLSYVFARDLNIRLRQDARYDLAHKALQGPLLVAAAIGTITDVMRLDNPMNRYLVQAGLKEINSRQYLGLNALMDVFGLTHVRESDIGFLIGPIMNAAGRMGQPDLAMELLTTRDPTRAEALAKQLVHANIERKILTESTAAQAFDKAESYLKKHPKSRFLMLEDARWDKGIIGIVASRLKERYGLPVALGASYIGVDGVARTTYSVRSIPGVDFFALALNPLLQQADSGLLSGGGHAMAAGMSIRTEAQPQVEKTMEAALSPAVKAARKSDRLSYEREAGLQEFQTPDYLQEILAQLGPTGTGAPPPRFMLRDVQVKRINRMGPNGQDLELVLGYPNREDILLKHGACFKNADTILGQALQSPHRHSEMLDVIIEPYLYDDHGKLAIGYTVVDSFPPRPFKARSKPIVSRIQQILAEGPKTPEPQTIQELRAIADIDDPHNAAAQKALKTLYEHKVCLLDTETTGRNAGKIIRTNGITQIAALKVTRNAEGQYIPVVKEWHISPHKPSYFAYQTIDKSKYHIDYKRSDFEYIIDTQAQDVTDTEFERKNPAADISTMRIGGKTITTAKPFYAVANEIFDFFEGTVPYAYNAPFDMPVMATHWQAVAEKDQSFRELGWFKRQHPEVMVQVAKQYDDRFSAPLRQRMKDHPELMKLFENPAHFHCAMYGALVHKGEAQRNRLTHTSERYGITFSRDEHKHDALEDVGPLVYMAADQIDAFGNVRDMRGLWETELQKIHPAFRVEETSLERIINKDGDSERVPGQLRVTYPAALAYDPKIQSVTALFQSFMQVSDYNHKSKSPVLLEPDETRAQMLEAEGLKSFVLLNKNKNSNSTTHWLRLLKLVAKWSQSTGQQQEATSGPTAYPTVNFACYDYASRADFTLTNADGSTTVIDDVPLGAYRRSANFIANPAQRGHLADYLATLKLLEELDITGIATISARGVEISGIQREFGDMTIAIPPQVPLTDFIRANKDQIKEMLKISGIPMVRSAYMDNGFTDEDDKKITQEEERERNSTAAVTSPIRLRSAIYFAPNPYVEMELSPALLHLVGKHMDPPETFHPGQMHLSGIHVSPTDDPSMLRLQGNLEAFKEIGTALRSTAWLMYRFQTLPSVRASLTKLDEKTETLTLYCSPSPRTEDLWILDRAHVPCHVFADRIEINLNPLLHEPHHWYKELTKELKFVKNNRRRVDKVREPWQLKEIVSALSTLRIDAYHTDRDHHSWIDFSGMRHVALDRDNYLQWPLSGLQQHLPFPQTVANITRPCAPNIAHLLSDSAGLHQPLLSRYEETPEGMIKLYDQDYSALGQHFETLGNAYRTQLGRSSVSMHINPLLDRLRLIAESPAMRLPHRMEHAAKAEAITALRQQMEQLLPQLLAMRREATETWRAFKDTKTSSAAFEEVAILDHLRLALLKQAEAAPDDATVRAHLATVQHYYERLSLAEFKKYDTETDLMSTSTKKKGAVLEDEGNKGEIPALDKAIIYLCGKQKKTAIEQGRVLLHPTPAFEVMSDAHLNNEYLALKRAFDNVWESTKELHRTLLFSREITETGMLLHNPAKQQELQAAATFVRQMSHDQVKQRLDYWQRRGLIDAVTDHGQQFDCTPSAHFKSHVHECAKSLLKLPELPGATPIDKATGYPIIASAATIRHLLEARHALETTPQPGLLPFLSLWQRHQKGPLVFTDIGLQQLFHSPLPLKPEDLFEQTAEGTWGAARHPGYLATVKYQEPILAFVADALNQGAEFYKTPQAKTWIESLHRHPAIATAWQQAFPDQPPFAQLGNKQLKQILQTPSPNQKKFVQALHAVNGLVALEQGAMGHAVARVNQEYPTQLPLVLYEGRAPATAWQKEGVSPGKAVTMSGHSFLGGLMQKADQQGAFLLHPDESRDAQHYASLAIAHTPTRSQLHTPNTSTKAVNFATAPWLDALSPAQWNAALCQHLSALSTAAEEVHQPIIAQIAPIKAALGRLGASQSNDAGEELATLARSHQIASLMRLCQTSPVMAAVHIAAMTSSSTAESSLSADKIFAALQARAERLGKDGMPWRTMLETLKYEVRQMERPGTPALTPNIGRRLQERNNPELRSLS